MSVVLCGWMRMNGMDQARELLVSCVLCHSLTNRAACLRHAQLMLMVMGDGG